MRAPVIVFILLLVVFQEDAMATWAWSSPISVSHPDRRPSYRDNATTDRVLAYDGGFLVVYSNVRLYRDAKLIAYKGGVAKKVPTPSLDFEMCCYAPQFFVDAEERLSYAYISSLSDGSRVEVGVYKFKNNQWIKGLPHEVHGDKGYAELVVLDHGYPAVIVVDDGYVGKDALSKFDGQKWIDVDPPYFEDADGYRASHVRYTFDREGIIYAWFNDPLAADGVEALKGQYYKDGAWRDLPKLVLPSGYHPMMGSIQDSVVTGPTGKSMVYAHTDENTDDMSDDKLLFSIYSNGVWRSETIALHLKQSSFFDGLSQRIITEESGGLILMLPIHSVIQTPKFKITTRINFYESSDNGLKQLASMDDSFFKDGDGIPDVAMMDRNGVKNIVAVVNGENATTKIPVIKSTTYANSAWQPLIEISNPNKSSFLPNLAINSAGEAMVGWTEGMLEIDGYSQAMASVWSNNGTQPPISGTARLTVSVIKGQGTISSSPSGIDCSSKCAFDFPRKSKVILTATPGANMKFINWSGACVGKKPVCSVNIKKNRTVKAKFR